MTISSAVGRGGASVLWAKPHAIPKKMGLSCCPAALDALD
jgi:hypothetical protein